MSWPANVHFRLPSVAQKRCMLKLSIKNVSSSCRILINFLLYCSLFSNNCGNVLLWCKVYIQQALLYLMYQSLSCTLLIVEATYVLINIVILIQCTNLVIVFPWWL